MNQSNSVPRVSSGIPWWLWLAAIAAVLVFVFGVIVSASAPTEDEIWASVLDQIELRQYGELEELAASLQEAGTSKERLQFVEGILAGAKKRDEKAIAKLKPLLSHEDKSLRLSAIRMSAAAQLRLGNVLETQRLNTMLIELTPGEIEGLMMQLRLYEDTKTLEAAANVARRILEIEPFNATAIDTLTLVLNATGRRDESLKLREEVFASEQGKMLASPTLFMNYVGGLLEQGRANEALEFFENNKARIVDPRIGVTLYRKTGDLAKSQKIWDELEHKAGSSAIPGVQLYAAKAAQDGNYKDAIDSLKFVATKFPRAMDPFKQLREIAETSGDIALMQTCDENIAAMNELDSQMSQAIQEVGSDLAGPEKRVKVGLLYAEIGRHDSALAWIEAAQKISGERINLHDQLQELHQKSRQMLVPFAEGVTQNNATVEGASDSEPEDASIPATEQEDADKTAEPVPTDASNQTNPT